MALAKKKKFSHATSALEHFIFKLEPSEEEVNAVYDAIEELLSNPQRGYKVPFSIVFHEVDLHRMDVNEKFAVHYETNGAVNLLEIFIRQS